MNRKRPLGVTLLACLVLIVAVINIIRLVEILQGWAFLVELLPFSPAYLALTGLVWGVVGLSLTWGIWQGQSWAPLFTGLAMLTYSVYYWVDRLLMPGNTDRNSNWPFAASVNLLVLAWGFWILSRRKSRNFFGEMYERKPES